MPSNRRKQTPRSARDEVRSHFVPPSEGQLPATVSPCKAPDGHFWVRAYAPNPVAPAPPPIQRTGKWLIHVTCDHVGYCWDRVRIATEAGQLGIAAKVSTDWHMRHDPAGPWNDHVICVYTSDFEDRIEAARVARALRVADAVRKQVLRYKPDLMTFRGEYAGNAPGEIAIYSSHPPTYEVLKIHESNLARVLPSAVPKKVYKRRPRCPGSLQKPTSVTPNSGHPLGACPSCGESFFLRADGKVWHHTTSA